MSLPDRPSLKSGFVLKARHACLFVYFSWESSQGAFHSEYEISCRQVKLKIVISMVLVAGKFLKIGA